MQSQQRIPQEVMWQGVLEPEWSLRVVPETKGTGRTYIPQHWTAIGGAALRRGFDIKIILLVWGISSEPSRAKLPSNWGNMRWIWEGSSSIHYDQQNLIFRFKNKHLNKQSGPMPDTLNIFVRLTWSYLFFCILGVALLIFWILKFFL